VDNLIGLSDVRGNFAIGARILYSNTGNVSIAQKIEEIYGLIHSIVSWCPFEFSGPIVVR
jgi:hypothetical protein